jgi:anaerobic magnesium-protoporphyrin IX monomethyl ester cyclase
MSQNSNFANMRVLLTTLNAKYIHTNLAIRLLYEHNRNLQCKNSIDLDWKEFTIKEDRAEIAGFCAAYDVVAFSCYIWNITQTLEVTANIKAINPRVKILLGGPEVSYDYDEIIKLEHVDFIISGEGEIPFRQFLESYPDIEHVSALIRKQGGNVLNNPSPQLFNLKEYENSMPYQFDMKVELFNKVLYIETSRGCPYKCGFCLASLDNKVRYLPDASIKATLLYLMEHGRVIKFLDRTFNVKKDFTLDIFRFILQHHKPGNVFQFEITADILHPEIIQFINEQVPSGLFRFEIGIQTVNQKANLEVSRKQNFDKTKQIIKALSSKVEMHLDLIVGLPLDYWEDVKFSIEEVFSLFPPEMQLGFLKFLKGTPVRDTHNKHGFVFDPAPPYQIIKSNYLSERELSDIVKLEHALEIYWNGKKALNTLRYVARHYSIFDFLLGLGVFFEWHRDFHKFSLKDIYEIITGFAHESYPEDKQLRELIAIDYYLHFKVKPQALFIASKDEKEYLMQHPELRGTTQKYRYFILPLSFNYDAFAKDEVIRKGDFDLVIRYEGTSRAQIIQTPATGTMESLQA